MREAAEALRLTAQDLKQLGVIDRIIPEALGGAHRFADETMAAVGKTLKAMLADMDKMDSKALIAQRREKFMNLGQTGLAA